MRKPRRNTKNTTKDAVVPVNLTASTPSNPPSVIPTSEEPQKQLIFVNNTVEDFRSGYVNHGKNTKGVHAQKRRREKNNAAQNQQSNPRGKF